MRDVAVAAGDRVPCANWPGARLYRYRGRLYAEADASCKAAVPDGEWAPGSVFHMGGLGALELVPGTGSGLSRERLPAAIQVTARASGEEFTPAGTRHRRPLRKWLQERGVLPWRRGQVPFLRSGPEIIAAGDLACGARFAAEPGEPSWVVVWRGRPQMTEEEVMNVKLDALDFHDPP